jgi:hypothetical protein
MSKTLRLLDNREKLLKAAESVVNAWNEGWVEAMDDMVRVLEEEIRKIEGGKE